MPDPHAMFDLHGRVAVVVGAGSGIGRAAALGLAAHGARTVCADLDAVAAGETATAAAAAGGAAEAAVVDVRDAASVEALATSEPAADILVVTPAINVRKPLLAMSDDEFDRVVDLNLKGTFRLVRAFGGPMAQRGRGSIIAFASIRASVTEPGQGVYAATKAGIVQLLRTLCAELGPSGVRVNIVAPGVVDTPLTAPIRAQPEWYGAYAAKTVLGRWAAAEELAGPVVFLASDAASYVTGAVLHVDGGWTAVDGRYAPPL